MTRHAFHKTSPLLDELVKAVGEPGNLRNTLQRTAQIACEFFRADYCTLFPFNPLTGRSLTAIIVPDSSPDDDMVLHKQQDLEKLFQFTLQEDIFQLADIQAEPEYQNILADTGIHSLAAFALRVTPQQKPFGVLLLYFKQQRDFSSADQETLHVFATQASFVLQETWLRIRFRGVAEIGQEINQELDTVDQLFHRLKNKLSSILDTSHALLLTVYQPQTNTFDIYLEDEGHIIHEDNAMLSGACFYVINTLKPQFVRQMSKEAEDLPFRLNSIAGTSVNESFIFVPLLLRNVPLGVLSIQHPQPDAYNEGDQFILQLLANHIALALNNIRLFNTMKLLNETGQFLTQQIASKSRLEEVVEIICTTTKADIVVLYPYEPTQQIMLSPLVAKMPKQSSSLPSLTSWPDIATRMLHHTAPIFAKESIAIYPVLTGTTRVQREGFQQRENIHSTAIIPLRVDNQAFGVLFVNFCQPQRFDAPQKLFIEGLAQYAAIAIKNARVLEELLQRRIDDLETLQDIDRALNRNLDLNHVLNTLLVLACERVPADGACILLYDPQGQSLEAKSAIGMHAEARQLLKLNAYKGKGITRWVFKEKQSALVRNVHQDIPWCDLYFEIVADTVSELDVPLRDGEEVVGVLNFESTKEGAFSQEDEAFLRTLAGQAVLAVKKAQAYEREKRFAEEGQVLNQISKEITSQLNAERVFDLILEKALELTDSNTGVLMLYDPEEDDLHMVAERGVLEDKKWQRHGLNQGIVGQVARRKEFLNIDPSLPPWNTFYLHYISGTRSELAVPMLEGGDKIRGVVNIESTTPNNFREGDVRLLQGLADLAVIALQNAERYEKAEKEKQRFELLYQAGRELGKISDISQFEQVYDVILHIAENYSQSQVVIRLYDEDTKELVLFCASHHARVSFLHKIKLNEGINGQVARERRTILVNDVYNLPLDVNEVMLTDDTIHSVIVAPIQFKNRYYGSLGLSHQKIGKFKKTDKDFFEGLAQQLASTIYRLETAQARQESEQRARSAEEMSLIGQSALGLTHRLGTLGLTAGYVDDIQKEMEQQNIDNTLITKKLGNILDVAEKVLQLSRKLKQELARSGEGTIGEQTIISPRIMLEEVFAHFTSWGLPIIQMEMMIDEDIAEIEVFPDLVTDSLHHLIQNAIEAMSEGGKITLKAYNTNRFVILEVTDTGPGIPEQKLLEIFGLFYSTKRSSGFGLWSARSNAIKNHGELLVESLLGRGTTFRLSLPKAGTSIS